MKIGILTLPFHTNYGGILQAYALQTILERMGHEVAVIDQSYNKNKIQWFQFPFTICKRCIKKYIMRRSCLIFYEKELNKLIPFTKQYIHRKQYNDLRNISQNEFDAIIVGSDQIWRPLYYPKIENAFLKFAENWNIKRIAYAASFGTEKWEYTSAQTNECARLLQKFDAISCRESQGVDMCKVYFQKKAHLVLDPTLLLQVEDYLKLIDRIKINHNKGTLFYHILDRTSEKDKIIHQIAREKELIPFKINTKKIENKTIHLKKFMYQPIEAWLKAFMDAEFVVTDSFHACVFSILFNKPFIVIGNEQRGIARFNSLLKMFSLEDRLISDKYNRKQLHDIDFNKINIKLEEYRNISREFLEQSL